MGKSSQNKYTHKHSGDNALNPLVCNHSECLAIAVCEHVCAFSGNESSCLLGIRVVYCVNW